MSRSLITQTHTAYHGLVTCIVVLGRYQLLCAAHTFLGLQGDSGFVFHHANAFETADRRVVVDAIRYLTLPDFEQACGSGRHFVQVTPSAIHITLLTTIFYPDVRIILLTTFMYPDVRIMLLTPILYPDVGLWLRFCTGQTCCGAYRHSYKQSCSILIAILYPDVEHVTFLTKIL